MIDAGVARMGVPANECLVIGDRLETDMAMGRAAGARTALVLTGVTKRNHLAAAPLQPDFVLENIGELARLLDKQ